MSETTDGGGVLALCEMPASALLRLLADELGLVPEAAEAGPVPTLALAICEVRRLLEDRRRLAAAEAEVTRLRVMLAGVGGMLGLPAEDGQLPGEPALLERLRGLLDAERRAFWAARP